MAELTTLARPYAKAVFAEASEKGALDAWSADLALLAACVADADMAKVLVHPSLTAQQQAQALTDVCGDKLNEAAKNLVAVLAENKRLMLVPEIAALYEELKAQLQNTVDVVVTSAFELSNEQADKLAQALKAKLQCDVRLTSEVDESLIGGAIIRAGDLVIDGSVTGKLSKLAEAMKS
ncbi:MULTISPECIES: F0F1 ATP synthase subunit delta [Oceanospirillaceae]|jgi:F-type H+-transporting ATPase subunit delta|uniref:F0F1 ATP synthase subunit delta n=1 Tax=Oceanospirillaceae TaxID=135620 RepID=UPI000C5E7493|nr:MULTISPECIES: F0F1 ATP synthase subunit delta [Thalassolituus]PIQ39109.1 MAG: F0F1 ATP synthase subunit delta [Thalassolituus sp. CG17_big_fil_post_rev_8_21_14_2_50_53_8]MCA6058977.1 F0F1 ATP synthase subunit delta [Thalassolituus sp. ST750PaO-4]MCB2387135.1 F0F1 ATP synthase subunit delta [Thalassolituus alkanivorans]MCB2421420.1 F0F1 ATP synthase subunit delta [Thalassolituus alkanivorans]TVV44672.1 F0F1 ATP synthase subunit delta [Thalassolituus sp. C2-1]